MKKGIFTVVLLIMTAAIMYAADCTCAAGCSSITAITMPFTKDGIADACYQTPCLGSSINSWNLATLNINGTDFTNKWADASTYPAAINGQYYIYYKATVSYGHFEALGTCSGSTSAPGDTIAPTNPPETPDPTTPPETLSPTTPPGVTTAPTETPGPTAIPTVTPGPGATSAPADTSAPVDTIVPTPAPTDPPGDTSAPGSVDCSTQAEWSANVTYTTSGSRVIYNGNLYESRWYTVNQNPELYHGPADPWTLIGACSADTLPNPTIVALPGANGYATRYWDCCKPHCSWENNPPPGMTPLQTCALDGITTQTDTLLQSSCSGGPAYTCYKLIPWAVNSSLSYGYAATSSGDICGRCFELTFTGEGHYGRSPGAEAIQGKIMIVQAINIGYDVAGGQVDIMIPGGGVGLFNACTNQWGIPVSELGAQYGGLLSACQEQVGYQDLAALKNCLRAKNDALFRSRGLTQMAAGLDWFIDWYQAADNPNVIVREVTCPAEIVANSGFQRP